MAAAPICRCTSKHEDESYNSAERTGSTKCKDGKSCDADLYNDGRIISYPPVTKICPDRLTSLIPPANFGAVDDGSIFRSSFPMPENFTFLKSLKLKTILTLVPEPFPTEYTDFMKENGILQVVVPIPANKEFVRIQADEAHRALNVIMDRSLHPLLVHCNKGKHRTGCIIGSFRKCQGESLPEIYAEYHVYADPKARVLDEAYLKGFDETPVLPLARDMGYVTDDGGVLVRGKSVEMGLAARLAMAVGLGGP